MSLIRIKTLLKNAFERIDERGKLREKHEAEQIKRLIESVMPKGFVYSFTFRRGILILYSSSAIFKQQVEMSKSEILNNLASADESLKIRDLVFKGPQR
jgi:hypothetical protein